MNLEKVIFTVLQFVLIHFIVVKCDCAIEKDPNVLTTCLQIDFTSIILGLKTVLKKKI